MASVTPTDFLTCLDGSSNQSKFENAFLQHSQGEEGPTNLIAIPEKPASGTTKAGIVALPTAMTFEHAVPIARRD